jgi:hypothetical protein
LNVEWARQQIAYLRKIGVPHQVLLDRLELKLAEDAQKLRQLEIAVNTPAMASHANNLTFILATNFKVMAEDYLAGLLHQGPLELKWRTLLLAEIRRLGLTWIDDLLVRLSRDLAVLSAFRDDTGIPVLFAPPNQHEAFLSLPGIYHEFGHCVERQFGEIIGQLRVAVVEYFAEEKLKIGPLPPLIRKNRADELDRAVEYWDKVRLAEIFCDVFAGYVCGATNLLSMVDLARANGVQPCSMAHAYPPFSTRVEVSYWALSDMQRDEPLVKTAWKDWKDFEARFPQPTAFLVRCPQRLTHKLGLVCNEQIARLLPGTPRYTAALPTLADAVAAQNGDDLRGLISCGMVVLWETPHDFLVWRAKAFLGVGLM